MENYLQQPRGEGYDRRRQQALQALRAVQGRPEFRSMSEEDQLAFMDEQLGELQGAAQEEQQFTGPVQTPTQQDVSSLGSTLRSVGETGVDIVNSLPLSMGGAALGSKLALKGASKIPSLSRNLQQYLGGLGGAAGGMAGEAANQALGLSPESGVNLGLSGAIPAVGETVGAVWRGTAKSRAASHPSLKGVLGKQMLEEVQVKAPREPGVPSDVLFDDARQLPEYAPPPTTLHVPSSIQGQTITMTPTQVFPIKMNATLPAAQKVKDFAARLTGAAGVNTEKIEALQSVTQYADTMTPEQIDATLKTLSGLQADEQYPELKHAVGELKDALWTDLMQSPMAQDLGEAYHTFKKERVFDQVQDIIMGVRGKFGRHDVVGNPKTLLKRVEDWAADPGNQHYFSPDRETGEPVIDQQGWRAFLETLQSQSDEVEQYTGGTGDLAVYGAGAGASYGMGSGIAEAVAGPGAGVTRGAGGALGVLAGVLGLASRKRRRIRQMVDPSPRGDMRRRSLLQSLRGTTPVKDPTLRSALTQGLLQGGLQFTEE